MNFPIEVVREKFPALSLTDKGPSPHLSRQPCRHAGAASGRRPDETLESVHRVIAMLRQERS